MSLEKISEGKRAFLFLFVSFFLFFLWVQSSVVPGKQAQEQAEQQVADPLLSSQVQSGQQNIGETPQAAVAVKKDLQQNSAIIQSAQTKVKRKEYIVETPLYTAKFDSLGGKFTSIVLKEFFETAKREQQHELLLNNPDTLTVLAGNLNDLDVSYQLIEASAQTRSKQQKKYILKDGQKLGLVFQGTLSDGNVITKKISFDANQYLFGVKVDLAQQIPAGVAVSMLWSEVHDPTEAKSRYNVRSFVRLEGDGSVQRDTVPSDPQVYPEMAVRWVGLGDNYFSTNIVNPNGLSMSKMSVSLNPQGKEVYRILLAGNSAGIDALVYAGPKDPAAMEVGGYDLNRSIDLGWFAMIGQPILALMNLFYDLLGNYGLAIVLTTILIKIVLLPLTASSYRSMQKMQQIQPEMQALRKRVTDPKNLQAEMLKIYQKHGVNPMGGCLPMLLQFPVFLGMYNALSSSIYLRHADFALWINDLSSPEKLMILGIPVPVMILIMGASMFLQTITTPTMADPNQKKIMYIMPVMFTVMFLIFPFPSGLVLYWLVNNVMSIIQQYTLRQERRLKPLMATLIAGLIVFAISFGITLL